MLLTARSRLRALRLAPLAGLVLLAALPAVAAEPAVDLSALRYYAERNEFDRYDAELKRLMTLYPDWTPPTDVSALAGPDPEAALWSLYGADDLDSLAAEIARLQAADPAFAPSADLAAKIAAKTLRRDLLAADAAGDAAKVLALAASAPDLGGCADLDVAWRIAAARKAAGTPAEALAAYRTLLETCDEAEGRRATVQKALALLGPAAIRPLLGLGRTGADGKAEFADLELDIARAEIATILADPTAPKPDAAAADRFAARALTEGPVADAALVGWWKRASSDHAAALAAFETAATLSGESPDLAKITEGIVLSLDGLGRREEAVARARDGRNRSPELAALYVALGAARFEGEPRPRLPDAEIAAYAAAVTETRSALGAEALGWYAHDYRQHAAAAGWFGFALEVDAGEGAARGLVLAKAAEGDLAKARSLRATWQERFPDLAALEIGSRGKAAGKPVATRCLPASSGATGRAASCSPTAAAPPPAGFRPPTA
ncbi:hypothetical protein [Methylobrevis pamukkalensis]|uniref:Tetratricopeptide repeat protein n=1 Tax=Methylobrevis pamukkalensis TaxID=1439726 RepID=A0A1E3GWS3_9HYPH|nr:hypothetical protein [Methylobrevis pamukkalensis]ODN68454.1 hypothetical protein A6302_04248 [Methylobrevis pamukkalensis]